VRRLALLVLLSFLPASAFAQSADKGDADALMAEIERDYAAAQGGDCATACRALDSMRRAADHLCELDPGDRCAKARQRVTAATDRVRASCPDCAQPQGNALSGRAGQPAPPAPVAADQAASKSAEPSAPESAPRKGGGCAGCTMSQGGDGLDLAVAVGGLALLAARRRRRPS
jgi:MYXO-CTERM domain-containing protein